MGAGAMPPRSGAAGSELNVSAAEFVPRWRSTAAGQPQSQHHSATGWLQMPAALERSSVGAGLVAQGERAGPDAQTQHRHRQQRQQQRQHSQQDQHRHQHQHQRRPRRNRNHQSPKERRGPEEQRGQRRREGTQRQPRDAEGQGQRSPQQHGSGRAQRHRRQRGAAQDRSARGAEGDGAWEPPTESAARAATGAGVEAYEPAAGASTVSYRPPLFRAQQQAVFAAVASALRENGRALPSTSSPGPARRSSDASASAAAAAAAAAAARAAEADDVAAVCRAGTRSEDAPPWADLPGDALALVAAHLSRGLGRPKPYRRTSARTGHLRDAVCFAATCRAFRAAAASAPTTITAVPDVNAVLSRGLGLARLGASSDAKQTDLPAAHCWAKAAVAAARLFPMANVLDLTGADAGDADVARALVPLRRLRALVLDRNARVTDVTMRRLIGDDQNTDGDIDADELEFAAELDELRILRRMSGIGLGDTPSEGEEAAADPRFGGAEGEARAAAEEPARAASANAGQPLVEDDLPPRPLLATLSVQRCYGMAAQAMLRLLQPQPKDSQLRCLRVLLLSHVAMPSSFLAAARGDAKPSGGSPALPSLRALGLLNCVAEVATADELVSAAAGLSPSLSVLLLGGTRLRRADMPVAAHPEEAALVVAAESTLPKLALLECTFCTRERSDARQSSLLAEGTDSTCAQHMALRGAGWDLMRLRDAVELAGGGRALLTRQGFGPTDASLMLRAAAQCAANGQRAPLHLAAAATASEGAATHCAALLSLGALVDFRDTSGATALFRAAEAGVHDSASMLAYAGASPLAATNAGETPLYIAALRAHEDIVRTLLDAAALRGTDWACRGAYADGWTPLHAAAVGDRVSIAAALLSAAHRSWGAEAARLLADESNRHGQTPAHVAARRGSVSMLKVFIGVGADMGVRDAMGRTPADVARREGKIEALALIAAAAGDDLASERRAARRASGDEESGGRCLKRRERRASTATDSLAISAALASATHT